MKGATADMLLQTNTYFVPPDKRDDHTRLMRRFRQALLRMGCERFEVCEQAGVNWEGPGKTGRFVQMMWFRDRWHHQSVQALERNDAEAQDLIREFSELVDLPRQQAQGLFVVGYYSESLPPGDESKVEL